MRISELKILKGVPFSQEDRRWLTFSSLTEQYNFFSSKKVVEFQNLSFVKGFLYKKIKIEADYKDIMLCNYIMFQNKQYSSKWIYAWIKGFEYISDGCTYIEIEIDYFQTYMGKIKFMPCRVIRQHSDISTEDFNSSWLYNAEEDEILPKEYTEIDESKVIFNTLEVCIFYKPNLVLDTIFGEYNIATLINGEDAYNYRNFLSNDYAQYRNAFGIPNCYYSGTALTTRPFRNETDLNNIINLTWTLEILGFTITNMIMRPVGDIYHEDRQVNEPQNPVFTDKIIRNLYQQEFKPLNLKTFDSPYLYIEVSNFSGTIKKYSYKLFNREVDGERHFEYYLTFLNGVKGVCFPAVYQGGNDRQENWDYGVPLGEMPQCHWNNQASGMLGDILNVLGGSLVGVATGNPLPVAGAVGNFSKNVITSSDTENRKITSMPILQASADTLGWIIKLYACKNLDEIDEFFSLKGYKFDEIMDMTILSRQRWNYLQTENANIMGDIPIEAKKIITDELNKGITFWHDKTNYDYFTTGTDGTRMYNNCVDRNLTNDFRIFKED